MASAAEPPSSDTEAVPMGAPLCFSEQRDIRPEDMAKHVVALDAPDERLDARVMRLSIGGREVLTPIKPTSSPHGSGMVEYSPRFRGSQIDRSMESGERLGNIPKESPGNGLSVIIPSYLDASITDRQMCHMESNIHPHTDLVCVPRWDGAIRRNNSQTLPEELWGLSRRYVEEVRRINGKLILGNIPINSPQAVVDLLVERYISADVTSFVLDYGACQAPGKKHVVRSITKILADYRCLDNSLLYSVNMRSSHDYLGVKPADDFLMFMGGLDVLGNYHMTGGGDSTRVKVFDRTAWIYRDEPLGGRDPGAVRAGNQHLINQEAESVRLQIREVGSAAPLARTKIGAREYMYGLAQTTLDLHGIRWGDRSGPR